MRSNTMEPRTNSNLASIPAQVAAVIERMDWPAVITRNSIEFEMFGDTLDRAANGNCSNLRREITRAIQNVTYTKRHDGSIYRYCWDKELKKRSSTWVRFRLMRANRRHVTRFTHCAASGCDVDIDKTCCGTPRCNLFAGYAPNGDLLCAHDTESHRRDVL